MALATGPHRFVGLSLAAQAAMVKDSRITYRRRHSYNTASNRIKVIKTPGESQSAPTFLLDLSCSSLADPGLL